MKIDILNPDPPHPVRPSLLKWIKDHSEHQAQLLTDSKQLQGGDLLFLISCSELIKKAQRDLYKKVLVIHASDLPDGKGWSPLIWQILEGQRKIVVSMFEAVDAVDAGDIWKKQSFDVAAHELIGEINEKLFAATTDLMSWAIENFLAVRPLAQENKPGKYYRKRTPADSELNLDKSLREQINLLRVCDPDRYPAFFIYEGKKFILKIEKID